MDILLAAAAIVAIGYGLLAVLRMVRIAALRVAAAAIGVLASITALIARALCSLAQGTRPSYPFNSK